MADPFDELEKQYGESDRPLLTTLRGVKGDPFAMLEAAQQQPYLGMNALTGGFLRDIPVVGPALESGAQSAAAGIRSRMYGTPYEQERQTVQDFAQRALAANPGLATAGGVAGNVAAFAPISATTIGAAALGARGLPVLGRIGENLGVRMGAGGLTGGALGAADAAVRGEDALTGATVGGLAGAAGPVAGGVMRGLVSPFNPLQRTIGQQAGQPAIDVLQNAGVRMPAGEVTGNRALRGFEDILRNYPGVSGRAEDIFKRRDADFTTAALRYVNPTVREGTLATPEVLRRERGELQTGLNAVRNSTVLYPGQDFLNDIRAAQQNYNRLQPLPTQSSPNVAAWFDNLERRLQQGSITGDTYQQMRTDLRQLADANLGPGRVATPDSQAYLAMRGALDAQMQRNVPPDLAQQWGDLNQRYANLKTIEDAMTTTGQEANKGFLSPARLAAAVQARTGNAFARGTGAELTDLAKAGAATLRPLPESGTGRQAIAASMLAAAGGTTGAALGLGGSDQDRNAVGAGTAGLIGAPLAALVAGRAALSGLGQRYLMNQWLSTPRAVSLAAGPLQEMFLPGRLPKTLRDLGD
jgi:hypothetical protein